jgi:hypothetical protein
MAGTGGRTGEPEATGVEAASAPKRSESSRCMPFEDCVAGIKSSLKSTSAPPYVCLLAVDVFQFLFFFFLSCQEFLIRAVNESRSDGAVPDGADG